MDRISPLCRCGRCWTPSCSSRSSPQSTGRSTFLAHLAATLVVDSIRISCVRSRISLPCDVGEPANRSLFSAYHHSRNTISPAASVGVGRGICRQSPALICSTTLPQGRDFAYRQLHSAVAAFGALAGGGAAEGVFGCAACREPDDHASADRQDHGRGNPDDFSHYGRQYPRARASPDGGRDGACRVGGDRRRPPLVGAPVRSKGSHNCNVAMRPMAPLPRRPCSRIAFGRRCVGDIHCD